MEKPKLDNARRLRGIYFIDPGRWRDREAIKNARKKLEILMEAAMHCKTGTKKWLKKLREIVSESHQSIKKTQKTKHACIVEAHESTRKRLESTPPKDHENDIAGKGYNWISRKNLVHKLPPMHQAMEIPDAKAAVDKEWKKLEMVPKLVIGRDEEPKGMLFWKQKERGKWSTLPHS